MSKLLVTGGSGFVGTNLVEYYRTQGWDVLNLDIVPPRNTAHTPFWRKVDIRDTALLAQTCKVFSPSVIYHMAARTDLEGTCVESYSANTLGVESMINVALALPTLEKVIFASSMLVCRLGYQPANDLDYCPVNPYGQSKVIGEQRVRELAADRFPWAIVRPTSLWGPWFDIPYRDFFSAVAKRRYVHPKGHRILRSYGFVQNAVHQLDRITAAIESEEVAGNVFYLADYQPIELLAWAQLISDRFGVPAPPEVPLALLQWAAKGGDIAKRVGVSRVPLTSSRLQNLLTQAVYDLSPLKAVAQDTPHSLEEAVNTTVDWMRDKDLER